MDEVFLYPGKNKIQVTDLIWIKFKVYLTIVKLTFNQRSLRHLLKKVYDTKLFYPLLTPVTRTGGEGINCQFVSEFERLITTTEFVEPKSSV